MRPPSLSTLFLALLLLALAPPSPAPAAESRDAKVLRDRDDVLGGGKWIYNDVNKGFTEARRTGKPLLVVLRCVP